MAIQNNLPDPINPINSQGEDSLGSYGPGFATVQLTSEQPIVTNKSNSGVNFRTINMYHTWSISIGYNEMTRAEFNVLYAFLLERQATAATFTVELPQYNNSVAGTKQVAAEALGGENFLTLNNITGINVGDLFYIANEDDATHKKAYMVTRLGSSNKIYISPGIQRKIESTDTATAIFENPKIQVMLSGNSIQYSLGTNGLYKVSLKVEEALV